MKDKVLKLLLESDKYISGEKISNNLGISRNSVWKYINKLKNDGYCISSVSNKGYMIVKRADVINPSLISTKDLSIIKNVVYYDEIDSTNIVAKNESFNEATVFIADSQTKGRGRLGKEWISPKGDGIWMSISVMPNMNIERIMQISLICGIAVCEGINEFCNIQSRIKWPNDIVYDGKKLCGILVEAVSEDKIATKVVSGIGINVNNTSFSDDIENIATSLKIITGNDYIRTDIINYILKKFEYYYLKYVKDEDLEEIIEKYKHLCINIGKRVVASGVGQSVEGVAIDISVNGELIISTDNGIKKAVNSGEVSVRGIYGYY